MAQFTPAILLAYLERGTPSLKSYNNRRGILSTFFKHALQNEWVVSNPDEKTPYHRINHRRGSATTLSAERTAELRAYVETFDGGVLVPYFAVCLFAGMRPCIRFGEIPKLQPHSIRLNTGVIHVEPEVSKVRMKRLVTIQPNRSAWLHAYPLEKYALIDKNHPDLRNKVFKKFGLTQDILRHTFISMFVAKFRSMGEVAIPRRNYAWRRLRPCKMATSMRFLPHTQNGRHPLREQTQISPVLPSGFGVIKPLGLIKRLS
jgi:integrase